MNKNNISAANSYAIDPDKKYDYGYHQLLIGKKIPKVVIKPIVSLSTGKPTRYDIYVEDVKGASCGYTICSTEADSWKDGIQRALQYSYNLGKYHGINKSKGLHNKRWYRWLVSRWNKTLTT